MKKTLSFILLLSLLALALPSFAEGREIALRTSVTKWGQMPARFEIKGQALPEGLDASDFAITGRAAGWESNDWHPFSCEVLAVEATGDGWALIPARFPDKYFYVRELTVSCEAAPELGFTLEDIQSTTTDVADDFTDVALCDGRVTAHVFAPSQAGPNPVVLVFHGYGDTANLLSYRTSVAWAEPQSQAVRPCTVISPAINTTFYGSEIARAKIYAAIMEYIDGLIEAGQADASRIYAMGNSFGGMASLEIAEQYPGRFAAILALCPALNYSAQATVGLSSLTDVPVTIAQAENDETIPSDVGKQAAEALTQAGNPNVTLRIYTDEEMNAAGAVHGYEQTYSFHHVELAVMEDAAYAEWLFGQCRE